MLDRLDPLTPPPSNVQDATCRRRASRFDGALGLSLFISPLLFFAQPMETLDRSLRVRRWLGAGCHVTFPTVAIRSSGTALRRVNSEFAMQPLDG
ncbi:hypothetical protein R3P38DRAFT_3202951 [Favolaschia claudopus]|uniref:Uncharacterized protein n=1 Tax=Favolaschia claudopus TaxID=2862362 RepID=A0AAW0AWZ6_9AGAR